MKLNQAIFAATLFALTADAEAPRKTVIRNNTISVSSPLDNGVYFGSVSAFRGNGPDGNPVSYIRLDVCTFQPDDQHRYCIYADGYAPVSALSATGTDLVTVNVPTISTFQGNVVDCTSGTCVGPLPLPHLAFHGTWKRYKGDFSFDYESAGITRNEGRYPDHTVTSLRTGIERSYSAEFRGNLGTSQFETKGTFGVANISSSRGISIEIMRTKR